MCNTTAANAAGRAANRHARGTEMFIQMYHERYMRFPEGKEKAVTFSYDDGVAADRKLIEILNKNGLKGTFNLNSELFDAQSWHNRLNEEETIALFKDSGHEIALHGARHIFLSKVPLPLAIKEVCDNRAYLEEKFGRIVNGMAYAYSGVNDEVAEVLKALGVQYARTTVSTHSFAIPSDWLHLNPTVHHTELCLEELTEKFLSGKPSDEFKNREPWLYYVWGHAYEFDDNGDWDRIEYLCRKVGQDKGVWAATNGDICDYVKCYNALVYSVDGERAYNPSHRSVWVEIRGKVYEVPSGATVQFGRA